MAILSSSVRYILLNKTRHVYKRNYFCYETAVLVLNKTLKFIFAFISSDIKFISIPRKMLRAILLLIFCVYY
jgi:hypothetical protein